MASNDAFGAPAPGITVDRPKESSATASEEADSSLSSPVPSYLHTPAESYDASSTDLRQLQLHSQVQQCMDVASDDQQRGTVLDAVASALQSEIDAAELAPGSVWYLVERKWFAAWQEVASGLVQRKVGPMDFSAIADMGGELLPDLKLGEDVEAVPADVWRKMVKLYGTQGPKAEVRRVVAVCADGGQAVLELYPPSVFFIAKSLLGMARSEDASRVAISLGASLAELKWQICNAAGFTDPERPLDPLGPLVLFRPTARTVGGMVSAQPPTYEAAVTGDNTADTGVEGIDARHIERIDADDSTSLMAAGILPESTVVFTFASLDESSSADVDASEYGGPFSRRMTMDDDAASEASSSYMAATASDPLRRGWDVYGADSGSIPSSGFNGDNADMGVSSTAVVRSSPASQVHYLCGLNNLGNTCFMNSALQCLGHFGDLTQYFVSNVHLRELNRDNPLGMKGAVASAYGHLVKAMWGIGQGSYAPRVFKQTIAQWAPQFRGYNQQDAPEFLSFLLDGMHEDLNRIVHKPYIEVPDADGRPDAEIADEQWDIYKRRNDSVVVDLFQGQFRSTLVCPVCSHVSVMFDPFMYLTLPLPVQRQKWVEVLFVPADPAVYATRMQLLVRKDDTIKQLKQTVGHFAQCDPARLLACDVLSTSIYSVYSDADGLGDIRDTDVVHLYELGTDAARAAADPASAPAAVVQLLCSQPSAPSSSYSYSSYSYGPEITTKPLFLTLPNCEVTLAELYLHIATALARWTTVDMSKITRQLQGACMGAKGGADERLLELLGQAACLRVHRGTAASSSFGGRTQYRNLSSISSYVYSGRRNPGPPDAFRAFEDRLTNDSCEPLVKAKHDKPSGDQAAADVAADRTAASAGPSALSPAVVAGTKGGGGAGSRRRVRSIGCADDYSTRWDSSSDNDGSGAMHGTPKRPRSNNGSDSEARDCVVARTAPERTVDADPQNSDKADSMDSSRDGPVSALDAPQAPGTQGNPEMVDAGDIGNSSDDDMASATAALSFSDLLSTKVQLSTGNTLICEWSKEGTKALLAELVGGQDSAAADPAKSMFDFERTDAFRMPEIEDATLYKDLAPAGRVALDQKPRTVVRPPSSHGQRQLRVTLEDCLNEFTRAEKLGEEDPWYCSKCKEHQQATKKFDLWRVPEILIVHLKRFQHSRAWRDKIDALVDFPLEGLDLTQKVVGQNGSELVYDLHAVCNHFGGLGGGHYTAYAHNPEDGKWYDFNDSHVSEVRDPSRVVTEAAYMLFYRLRPQPPSSALQTSAHSAAAKIERLIADSKADAAARAADGRPAVGDEDEVLALASRAPAHSPHSMVLSSDESDSSRSAVGLASNVNALVAIGPVGLDSPRSDVGSASDMDSDSPLRAPADLPASSGPDDSDHFMS